MSFAHYRFPLKKEGKENWCSLASMGIRRLGIIAYHFDVKEKYPFAGGHRHRFAVAQKDIHLLFPPDHEIVVDVSEVKTASPPKRKHDKRR